MPKKVFYAFLLFILSFLSFNSVVNAEEYIGEILPRSKWTDELKIGKVTMKSFNIIRYVFANTNIGRRLNMEAEFHSDYEKDIVATVKVKLYDANQNVLADYTDEIKMGLLQNGSYNRVVSKENDNINVDDVAFYKLEIFIPNEATIFDKADKGEYFYVDYNVEVDVKMNNVYDIKQNFTAKFNEAARAVNVHIPYRHFYVDKNNKKINRRAIISNIKSTDTFTEMVEEGDKVVTIGQADPFATEKKFDIEYSYNVGKDKLRDNDEFVYYLIKDVPVNIDGLTFKITMPAEFNKDYINFVDDMGNKIEQIDYQVEGQTITGKIEGMIEADSAYAIKIILPDGYFVNTTLNISSKTWIAFIVPIVLMISTITICFVSKRPKNNKTEKAGLYINEDIDSLELGYILKGGLKETDISTLIFCLANKKYVEIKNKNGNYTINKLRDYDGHKNLEGILMKRLFANGDVVTRKDLKENLKNLKEEIDKNLKYKKKKRYYIRPFLNYKLIFWVLIYFIYYLVMDNMLFEYQPSNIFINVIVGFLGLVIMLGTMTSKNYQLIEKVLCTMVGLVLIVSPIILTSYLAFVQDVLYIAAYIIGIVCIISIAITSSLMNNRTTLGNYMYRKIVAYKSYLVNVSEEEIQEEMNKNENYFYDVLPYVLVMGMSDKFYNKFENIPMKAPDWYEINKFNLEDFYEEAKNIYSDFFIAMKNK